MGSGMVLSGHSASNLHNCNQDLVAGSMALDGQIDEFRSAHRTIANGELNQTSTDQLLSTFVKGSVHQENGSLWDGAAAAIQEADIQEEFIEECYYSDDDFEDLDDVEEESMVFVQVQTDQWRLVLHLRFVDQRYSPHQSRGTTTPLLSLTLHVEHPFLIPPCHHSSPGECCTEGHFGTSRSPVW